MVDKEFPVFKKKTEKNKKIFLVFDLNKTCEKNDNLSMENFEIFAEWLISNFKNICAASGASKSSNFVKKLTNVSNFCVSDDDCDDCDE